MRTTILFVSLLAACGARAQTPSLDPATQFDFWLGAWDLTWADGGHGTNQITKELDGKVIHEHSADPGTKYLGESWSVWDPNARMWRQTWVDSQGAYMTFEGGMADGRMELSRHEPDKQTGQLYLWRMVFFNLTADSMEWEWKRSADEGVTWEVKWAIHYTRKA